MFDTLVEDSLRNNIKKKKKKKERKKISFIYTILWSMNFVDIEVDNAWLIEGER